MIHGYQLNGYNIIIDVYSGAVHSVDKVAYDIIMMYENMPKSVIIDTVCAKHSVSRQEVEDCIKEVETLIESGQLFTEDVYQDKAGVLKQKNNVIKALCLHVAHTCNLNCSYCFASQGKYQGDRALMSFEVGKRALDFLIENSGTRRYIEVALFRGEPLMNWDLVSRLVEY